MIHLTIDTSALRLTAPETGALALLHEARKLQVYLPELVKCEYLSQRLEDVRKDVKLACKSLNALVNPCFGRPPVREIVEATRAALDDAKDGLLDDEERRFVAMLDLLGVEIQPFALPHARAVFDAYFAGRPPFKGQKNRNDLPDAFIFQAIKDIAGRVDALHVVVADKTLAQACRGLGGVVAHENMAAFLASDVCKPLLRHATEADNLGLLYDHLAADISPVREFINTELPGALQAREVMSDAIADDNNEGYISGVDEPTNTAIGDALDYYGDGVVLVPFTTEVEVLVDYTIFKRDYYCLDEARAASISISDRNTHYFEAQEYFVAHVSGRIELSLEPPGITELLTVNDLVGLVRDGSMSLELDSIELR